MNIRECARTQVSIVCAAALFMSSHAGAQKKPLTAGQIISRLQYHMSVPWQPDTVDTFKAGNPDTPITGIAVTMMATMDVLQRASAKGLNFVITHEPTFYAHLDTP